MTTLDQLSPQSKGTVKEITGEKMLRRRLFDMGVTPGVEVLVCKVAPLADPIEIKVRGYQLSIRKAEAKAVCVIEVD